MRAEFLSCQTERIFTEMRSKEPARKRKHVPFIFIAPVCQTKGADSEKWTGCPLDTGAWRFAVAC